jgi:predicted transcriptional regulator
MRIGEFIKKKRDKWNVSQEHVANLLQVAQQFLGQIERGDVLFPKRRLKLFMFHFEESKERSLKMMGDQYEYCLKKFCERKDWNFEP